MSKICFVTTSPLIVNFFLLPHLLNLARRHEVSLAVRLPGEAPLRPLPGIDVIAVDIRREIAPLHDAAALVALQRLYRKRRFDLVHSFASKAGLLSSTAGWMAGTRARVHTFIGQVWATRTGPMRTLLRAADTTTARMATHVFADSAAQRDFLVQEGVVKPGHCRVLGKGSVSGVDLHRFRPDAAARREVRSEWGLDEATPVIMFLARLTRDKGILDLARAFGQVGGNAALAVVGPDEEGLRDEVLKLSAASASRVRFAGYTDAPERYLAAADLLCVPSHREGFSTVIISAAAAGVPTVGSRIYGVVDTMVEGETGLLFTPGDVQDLARQLAALVADRAWRERLGAAARSRAQTDFSQEAVVEALETHYDEILQ